MISRIERALTKYEETLDSFFMNSGQIFIGLAILVVLVGQVWSRFSAKRHPSSPPPTVRAMDLTRESDRRFKEAMMTVMPNDASFDFAVIVSDDINAASMGDGHYLMWEGLASLPDWAIVAIAAHEYSHDQLLHSVKEHDRTDFALFWTDLIGSVGGADIRESEIINRWGVNLVLPRFSKIDEFEADRNAIKILDNLGIQKPGVVYAQSLELLIQHYGDTGGKYSDRHPATSERIRIARSVG